MLLPNFVVRLRWSDGLWVRLPRSIKAIERRSVASVVIGALLMVFAPTAVARPIITEVAWMGSDASSSDEWIEVYNPDADAICDLSTFVLVGAGSGAANLALPAVGLAAGDFFVVQHTAGTPVADASHSVVATGLNLTNAGEALRLCPADSFADATTCDVVNTGAAWFAGNNTVPKRTMERSAADGDPSLGTSWQDGTAQSPLNAEFAGTPGSLDACALPDAGFVDAGTADAGNPDPVDAGPNSAPTISISAPATVQNTADGAVSIVYDAADADAPNGDRVDVELYASSAASGLGGIRIARGLPQGTQRTFVLGADVLPAGSYRLLARAADTRGGEAWAQAPAGVVVAGGAVVDATLAFTEPDGVNDIDATGAVSVTWTVSVPADAVGTLALFLDTNDDAAGGRPLAGGLAVGADSPRSFRWDTTLQDPGEYYVYGVLETARGAIVAKAPAPVSVVAPGCGCGEARVKRSNWTLVVIGFLFVRVLGIVPRNARRALRKGR